LAALLGRAGLSVLLLDQCRFPSDTLSTHFFRGGAFLEVLRRTGALEATLRLGSPPLRREYLYTAGSETAEVGPPQTPGDIGYNLSVRRVTLDATLVDHASQAGDVKVALATRAVGLHREGGAVVGIDVVSPEGRQTIPASLIVGADGRNSWVAREVQAPVETSEAGHRAMYYAYYSEFRAPAGVPDGAEFSTHGDEVAYVFPSDGSTACIAVSVNLEAYPWIREIPGERFVATLRTRHPAIGNRIERPRREGRVMGAGPTRNFVRRPYGPGWALVGDSEMHQDPFSGQGIDSAGLHAALLAEEIVRWKRGEVDWPAAGRSYAERRDAQSLEIYETTVRASRDLAAPPPEPSSPASPRDPDS
jgi:2-polyprenyl-6-methoxyphenol hydroxylase-like FAD-dependent oxidoreductase